MAQIGLFYGSETGNTARVAQLLATEFKNDIVVQEITLDSAAQIQMHNLLIFGTSTWDDGHLAAPWQKFIPSLEKIDFSGKKVAFFGLGDQKTYWDTFVDGMAFLYDKVIEQGGTVVGRWPNEGYTETASKAIVDDTFVGLPLDEENQPDLTKERVKQWVEQLRRELF